MDCNPEDLKSPQWKQKFSFPLKCPKNENLQILVKDKFIGPVGTMTVPLSNFITARGLTMEGWFNLHLAEPHGAVLMKLELKVVVLSNAGGESSSSKGFTAKSDQVTNYYEAQTDKD